jgi:hypothetical protein
MTRVTLAASRDEDRGRQARPTNSASVGMEVGLVIAVDGRVGIGIIVAVELGLRVMPVAGVLVAVEVGLLDSVGNGRVEEGMFDFGKLSLKIFWIDMILQRSPINAQLPMQSSRIIPKVFLRLSFTIVSNKTSSHWRRLIVHWPLVVKWGHYKSISCSIIAQNRFFS